MILVFIVILITAAAVIASRLAKKDVEARFSGQKASYSSGQKINYTNINYKKLYIEKYRVLPNIYFYVTLVVVSIIGALEIILFSKMLRSSYKGIFSFIVGSEDYISGMLALVIWGLIAYLTARFVRYITAISLSQKIVVADTLLANARAAVSPKSSASASSAPASAPAAASTPKPAAPVQNTKPTPAVSSAVPASANKAPASDAGNQPVYVYNGHNADLYVYSTKIVIAGKNFNRSMGEKTIPMHTISAVQMKASTPMVYGCIEFNVAGEIASSTAGIGAGIRGRTSENTVVFASNKDDAKVKQIKEYIESIIYSQKAGSQTVIQQTSNADELKKYKELLDMNIITQEEFEEKKKQLLGL